MCDGDDSSMYFACFLSKIIFRFFFFNFFKKKYNIFRLLHIGCIDCSGVPNGSSKYDECDVCDGDGTSCCGPQTVRQHPCNDFQLDFTFLLCLSRLQGRECCVNYSGVPDPYWDFVLLPVTLNDVIDKLRFTNEVFAYLASALPPYDLIGPQSRDLHFGRMAEFNNVFLTVRLVVVIVIVVVCLFVLIAPRELSIY